MRADVRFIKRLSELNSKEELSNKDMLTISYKFLAQGGTWIGVFQGDPKQISKLKELVGEYEKPKD